MSCEPMVELMQRDLDHDLTPTEKMTLQAHLVECPECAGLNERLQLLSLGLEQLPKVKPSFSIVDSILPQLESIVIEPPPAPAVKDELAERRENKRWFSWKAASGAVAAALVIGVFIFQAGNGGFMNSKSELADSSYQGQRMSAATEAAQAPSAALEGVQEGAVTFTTAQTEVALTLKDQFRKNLDSGDASVSGNDASAMRKQESVIDNQTDLPAARSGGGTAPSFGTAGSPDGGQATEENSGSALEVGITSFGEPAGSSEQENKADGNSSYSLKGMASAPESAPAHRMQPIASPGGVYTAQLHESNAVTITNKNGESVFLSSVKLEPGDLLIFDGWSGDNEFTYRIQFSAGGEATYRIDVAALKEMKS